MNPYNNTNKKLHTHVYEKKSSQNWKKFLTCHKKNIIKNLYELYEYTKKVVHQCFYYKKVKKIRRKRERVAKSFYIQNNWHYVRYFSLTYHQEKKKTRKRDERKRLISFIQFIFFVVYNQIVLLLFNLYNM